jgi:hypothetical protein
MTTKGETGKAWAAAHLFGIPGATPRERRHS